MNPIAPNQRTFSLNSWEFYEAVAEPEAQPWIKAGSLPREPRTWGQAVVVEARRFGPIAKRPDATRSRAAGFGTGGS